MHHVASSESAAKVDSACLRLEKRVRLLPEEESLRGLLCQTPSLTQGSKFQYEHAYVYVYVGVDVDVDVDVHGN